MYLGFLWDTCKIHAKCQDTCILLECNRAFKIHLRYIKIHPGYMYSTGYMQDTCRIHPDTTGYVSDRKSPPKTIGNPPSPVDSTGDAKMSVSIDVTQFAARWVDAMGDAMSVEEGRVLPSTRPPPPWPPPKLGNGSVKEWRAHAKRLATPSRRSPTKVALVATVLGYQCAVHAIAAPVLGVLRFRVNVHSNRRNPLPGRRQCRQADSG